MDLVVHSKLFDLDIPDGPHQPIPETQPQSPIALGVGPDKRCFIGEDEIAPYTILSHTWGSDTEELTFHDLKNGIGKD